MRKKLKAVKEDLYEALKLIRYAQTRETDYSTEWRRFCYHLIVNTSKSRLALRLHRDIAIPTPPFHKAVQNAPDVAAELAKIIDAYKKRRLGKSG